MCQCVGGRGGKRQQEDSLRELVLCLYHVGPGDQMQVFGLVASDLTPYTTLFTKAEIRNILRFSVDSVNKCYVNK